MFFWCSVPRPPSPFANTMLHSWVWKGLACFEASLPGFEKKRLGGWGGGGRSPPPHLRTQCSHHGFGRDSHALKQACPALKKKAGGFGGGRSPPPFANTMLASWVWKGLACFDASLLGFENKGGGIGGGRSPSPFANTVLASWVWKGRACFEASLPGFDTHQLTQGGKSMVWGSEKAVRGSKKWRCRVEKVGSRG